MTTGPNMRATALEDLELFLLNLRYKAGRLVKAEGNRPQLLTNPGDIWVVYSGAADLFAVPLNDGAVSGTRRHLFRAEPGQLLFAIGDATAPLGLLASGSPGTQLLRIPYDRFWEMARDLEYRDIIAAMIDDWVAALARNLVLHAPPKVDRTLPAGVNTPLPVGEIGSTNEHVIWVELAKGRLNYISNLVPPWLATDPPLPLTRHIWFEAEAESQIATLATIDILGDERATNGLEQFHSRSQQILAAQRDADVAAEETRLAAKVEAEAAVMAQSLAALQTPLDADVSVGLDAADTADLLYATLKLVGDDLNVTIEPPVLLSTDDKEPFAIVDNIMRRSGMRLRDVQLRDNWWTKDAGPLLAYREKDNRPVALLVKHSRYELVDLVDNTRQRVTPALAAELAPLAYSFYRPFPNHSLAVWDVIRFGLEGNRDTVWVVIAAATLISLLGLLTPIATGIIFDQLIPAAQVNLLLQVGLGLFVSAMALATFRVIRGVALIRLISRVDTSLQAATWDRLLKLPLTFFRDYAAGNLGSRAMGFATIKRIISGYVITTLLTSLFSVFNLALLFYYSPSLALIAIVLVVVTLTATVIASTKYLRYQRELMDVQGVVSGQVLQLLNGIAKFRVAGAENHAFNLWSDKFSLQKRLYTESRIVTNRLTTFNVSFSLAASIILFGAIVYLRDINLSTGDFVAFNTAFAQFLGSWIMLSMTLVSILTVVPMYERLRPILTAVPEVDDSKVHPGELQGTLEVSHVSFRYDEDGPLVLQDVSIEADQGEFIAIVGASGSGKSTLLRLLLGFETPQVGGIYFDNQDLKDLDLREVRRQLGVVLQGAMLMNGDIFENIVGASSSLTVDDAWEAARAVGVAEDIEKMPMGMHTIISERGGNLSGGQRQRILIAASIVHRPRIIFFDEATSALDNRTQEIVSQSLEQLHATRVVIAHRLSTIMNADRIYVMDKGRVVQQGTYENLLKEAGPFAELARRQMA